MRNLLKNAINTIFNRSAGLQKEPQFPQRVRSFAGGTPSRLTAGFMATNTSIDADLYAGLETMRARCRQLSQNNPYGKKFLSMVASNVVGHQGFVLQARAADTKIVAGKVVKTTDSLANRAIESSHADWSKQGVCDTTGTLDFSSLCRVLIRAIACDGEALVRVHRARGLNAFGYQLQLLDIDRLDVNFNQALPSGNIVRMSVELNAVGRPVAYWLRTTHPGDNGPKAQHDVQRERVLASDLYHLFIPIRPEQRRGVPWMHAGIESLYHLGELNQSALVAARKGADTLGFFVSKDGQPPSVNDDGDAPIEISVAGSFDTLPDGVELQKYESAYPSEVYGVFHKDCLRSVSSALDVAYNGLGNDLEGVNFSSIRAGMLEERETWMLIQTWLVGAFVELHTYDWLRMSLANSAITMENGSALPAAKYEKFKAHTWMGRRWPWVDPKNDIESAILAIDNLLDSPQRIAATQGRDIEDVLDDIAEFEQMMQDRNLKKTKQMNQPQAPAPQQPTKGTP